MSSGVSVANPKDGIYLGVFLSVIFVLNLGIGIVPPLLVDIQRSLDLSLLQVSLITTAFGIGRLLGDLPAGILMDRVGPFSGFTIGLVLILLGTTASGFATSGVLLLGGRVLAGLGHALDIVASLSILMDKYGPSRWGRVTNVLEFTGIGAQMLSALAAGKLTVLIGWRSAFFFASVMVLISLGLALFGLRWQDDWHVLERGDPPLPAMKKAGPDGRACSRAGRFTPESVVLGAAFLLAFGYGGMFQTLLPLRSGLLPGFDAGDIATLMTAGYVADLLLLIPIGRLSDQKGKTRILAGGLASLLLGALFFGNGRGPLSLHLSSILLGASLSTWMMPPALVAARRGRQRRGKALGLYRFVVDSGYILGPVVLGFIVEHQGYRVAGMMFAGLVASVLLLILSWTTLTAENPA